LAFGLAFSGREGGEEIVLSGAGRRGWKGFSHGEFDESKDLVV